MVRNILGAVLGYVAMVVVVLGGIGLMWTVLGPSGAFAGEGPRPSTPWILGNLVSGFIAALLGGRIALAVGKNQLAVRVLLGLVLVLGLGGAIVAGLSPMPRPPLGKPIGELRFVEAGGYAEQPAWYNWLIPIIGAVGVFVGGRTRSGAEGAS